MPKEYIEYRLMKAMHWTYDELLATPAEVVNNSIRYMNTEAKHKQQEAK